MTPDERPLACALDALSVEERGRRAALAQALTDAAVRIRDVQDGCAIDVAMRDDVWLAIAELILLERRCCPFLSFSVAIARDAPTAVVTITGPVGARAFIRDAFSLGSRQ